MTVALDTNVIQAILQPHHVFHHQALQTLETLRSGGFCISAPVYVESLAIPKLSRAALDEFLAEVGISVDWALPEEVWVQAGMAQIVHLERRRAQRNTESKRLLVDFLIGSHALSRGFGLITFDPSGYRVAFPALKLLP